ncbi:MULTISPECIES: bacterioferritin-associated ferredoxin [Musicola]|uniref:Bacterioferritin-associated ferredoxin n=1 Tax=Musicola paradisiaca (strain Ech703) TaxID=579405 RepID=C6C870_MUSP7|nr:MULTISPECIES: bacterioferritin-associated ferredoxin [Musicola]ACS84215.1 BFD domain protein (2Fe-2S)-binding domain protein [Musicola paradisiaca Ech703]
MYVCLCNAVSDKVIRQIARQYHPQSLKQLKLFVPIGSECGKCIRQARLILEEETAKNAKLNKVA